MGPTVTKPVQDSLAVLILNNRLYIDRVRSKPYLNFKQITLYSWFSIRSRVSLRSGSQINMVETYYCDQDLIVIQRGSE